MCIRDRLTGKRGQILGMNPDERGVAHGFFSRDQLRALLDPYFAIESLEEHDAAEIAGSWAHRQRPLYGAVHWLAVATAR